MSNLTCPERVHPLVGLSILLTVGVACSDIAAPPSGEWADAGAVSAGDVTLDFAFGLGDPATSDLTVLQSDADERDDGAVPSEAGDVSGDAVPDTGTDPLRLSDWRDSSGTERDGDSSDADDSSLDFRDPTDSRDSRGTDQNGGVRLYSSHTYPAAQSTIGCGKFRGFRSRSEWVSVQEVRGRKTQLGQPVPRTLSAE